MMKSIIPLIVMIGIAMHCQSGNAQSETKFTFQGELKTGGNPANGSYGMVFSLWDSMSGGNQIGFNQTLVNVAVIGGKFTVELDFGASAFSSDRWLRVVVDGVQLSPRQPITRAPYSIQTRGIFVDASKKVGIGTMAPNYPLHVEAASGGSAIFGLATSGTTYGIYGRTNSGAASRGVFGYATAPNGFAEGVQGRSDSVNGTGVAGFASAASVIS